MRTPSYPVRRVLSLLGAALAVVACSDIIEPTDQYGLTGLTAADTATADGASIVAISVSVDTTLTGASRNVMVHASAGTFGGKSDITITPDANGKGIAYLKAPANPDTALVTATAGSVTMTKVIAFGVARPDRIVLVPSQFTIAAANGTTITLTASISRTTGAPATGAIVTFSVRGVTDPAAIFAHAPPSDVNGKVAILFSAGDAAPLGSLYLFVSTLGASGAMISDSVAITVVGH